MEKRTAEEYQAQAKKINKKEWVIRPCSICEYPLAYIFNEENVGFDSGCDCVGGGSVITSRSWQDVANMRNIQNEETQEKMDKEWEFTN